MTPCPAANPALSTLAAAGFSWCWHWRHGLGLSACRAGAAPGPDPHCSLLGSCPAATGPMWQWGHGELVQCGKAGTSWLQCPELLLQRSWGLLLHLAFGHHAGVHTGLEERGAPALPPAVPRALKSQWGLHVAETVGIRQSWTATMFLIPCQMQGYDCTNSSTKLPKAAGTSVTWEPAGHNDNKVVITRTPNCPGKLTCTPQCVRPLQHLPSCNLGNSGLSSQVHGPGTLHNSSPEANHNGLQVFTH